MFLRFSAIAVLRMAITASIAGAILVNPASLEASARDAAFAKHFAPTTPPEPVPLFQFEDSNGVSHDLREYRGQYVLLNLWATWCGPCISEMPSLNALPENLDMRHVVIIALNEDRNGSVAAEAFYTRHNLTHLPVFIDASGQAPFILHAPGIPVTLLINPKGYEIGRLEGEADWTAPDTITFLKSKMGI